MADPTYSGTRRIIDETEVSAPASDAYLVVDGQASGTNKISYTNAVTNPLTVVNQTISTANNRITTLESEMDTAQTDISSLQSSVSNAQNDITSLKSRTSNAEGAIDTMQTSIAQLESDVDNIESDVDNIENGYNPNLKAGVLMASEPYQTDSYPYLSKQIPVSGREMLELVGGTVAWNQFAEDYSGVATVAGVTITQQSDGSYLLNGTATSTNYFWIRLNGSTPPIPDYIKAGHRYYCTSNTADTDKARLQFILYGSPAFVWTELRTKVVTVPNDISGYTSFGLVIQILANVTYDNFRLAVQLTDLTQMFGSTIADYVYSLEQASAGSGIAWLKSFGFFTEDYYPYNAGELLSVKTSAHETVGKNLLDIPTLDGVSVASNSMTIIENGIRLTKTSNAGRYSPRLFYLPSSFAGKTVTVSADIKISGTQNGGIRAIAYSGTYTQVASYGEVGGTSGRLSKTFTFPDEIPSNATGFAIDLYCAFTVAAQVGDYTEYTNIQIEYGTTATTYAPYEKTTYPLSNIELRGIPKLVSNELQYDGDTYASDGTVTRRFGIVTLNGSESWEWSSNNALAITAVTGGVITDASSQYDTFTFNSSAKFTDSSWVRRATNSPSLGMYFGASLVFVKSADIASANDAKAYFTANPTTVIYALATPTTETTDAYESVIPVEENGVESFVDTRDVPVPVGNNTEYYYDMTATDIIDYIEELTKPTEDDMIANANIASGKYFMVGNRLFISTAAIAQGATIVPNTNCTEVSLADALNQINA